MEKWGILIHELGHAISRRSDIVHSEAWGEAVGQGKRDDRGENALKGAKPELPITPKYAVMR